MNGKDRALAALYFEKVDRVPLLGGMVENAKWLEKASGIKLRYGFSLHRWENPMRAALKAYKNVGADIIRGPILLPKSPFKESLARETTLGFKTAEDVLKYIDLLPSISELRADFNFESVYYTFLRNFKESQEECGEDMLWSESYAGKACRFMWYTLFGYKPFLTACLRYKDEIKKLFNYSAEEAYLINEAIAKAIIENDLPPFLRFGEDICTNRGPMLSPAILDEIYFPYLRRSLEPLRRENVRIIWHSDGNIMPIINRLIDVGVNGFQGFQEETGPRLEIISSLKTKDGKKPIIWGSISVSRTLSVGDIEDVKRDVGRCIKIAAPGGGFILAPSTSIGPEVPIENIFAFFKYGKKYGKEYV